MLNFYPGPSKLRADVLPVIEQGFSSGELAYNHRSPVFEHYFREAQANIRQALQVPESYAIHFVSSATECWEICAQSFTNNESTHCYNGAFGEKWSQKATLLGKVTRDIIFDINESIPSETLQNFEDLICITSCETSNGTKVSDDAIEKIKHVNPNALLAVDATSSLGGFKHNINLADVWFASVQKCFGLPAGLAILITSPKALVRAKEIGERKHYNSFLNIEKNTALAQTTHTPNVIGIYTLSKIKLKAITEENQIIKRRKEHFMQAIETSPFSLLTQNDAIQSETILCLRSDVALSEVFEKAEKEAIILGKGYGKLKDSTFRVANFPAHTQEDFDKLVSFLTQF